MSEGQKEVCARTETLDETEADTDSGRERTVDDRGPLKSRGNNRNTLRNTRTDIHTETYTQRHTDTCRDTDSQVVIIETTTVEVVVMMILYRLVVETDRERSRIHRLIRAYRGSTVSFAIDKTQKTRRRRRHRSLSTHRPNRGQTNTRPVLI